MILLFLTYQLKVAVLVAVFYIFWRLLLANETWHRLNRIVLLSTALASFVLPFCVITIHQTVETEPITVIAPTEEMPMTEDAPTTAEHPAITAGTHPADDPELPFDWQLPLAMLYIIGVLVVLGRMLLSIRRLHQMRQESEIHPISADCEIAVCDEAKTPFSWWNTIYMNRKDYEEGTTALLTHELEHIRLHHSQDVLLVEVLTALQWFNPTIWMLRADLRTLHEYEADQQVISHGFNDIQYLHLLIRKAASRGGYSLANGISNSTLKKRVTMMMKPQSNRWQWLRAAYLLPVIALSLYASCKTEVNYQSKEEPALVLTEKDGQECIGVKAPVGAFYSWLVNGRLAERGMVREDGRWNVMTYLPLTDYVFTLDDQPVSKDSIPYVPLSSIKEVKYLQGENPRRIELYTKYVSGFSREGTIEWPEEYKENMKAWMFVQVEDAATGRQLSGATVSIEGTDVKAKTNSEGWCELKVPLGSTLKAEYPGMETQMQKIDQMSGSEVKGCNFWLYRPGQHIYSEWTVQQEPKFPGDEQQWITNHVQLSEDVRKEGHLGRVTVMFVVNEDGSVSGARLRQGVRKELNDEALRVVSSMPRWKPALKDGKPVKCLVIKGVSFG